MILDKFHNLLSEVITNNVSDVHIVAGDCPYIRAPLWNLQKLLDFGPVWPEGVKELVRHMLEQSGMKREIDFFDLDLTYMYKTYRFRVNISQNEVGYAVSMRKVNLLIPKPEEIGVGKDLLKYLHNDQGLILITGWAGTGKSTTLAAMLEYINQNFERHIITVEDPIEYVYFNKKSLFHQRELGTHTDSFEQAIKSALREDPDVIVIGEMRDQATFEAALTLAETGHLVLSTLHTNDCVQTLDRIIYSFPPIIQGQIRMQLALSLTAIISQVLVPRTDNQGRIAAREVLINASWVQNLIIRGETHNLYSMMETGRESGMSLMDHALRDLYNAGTISWETLLFYMKDKTHLPPQNVIK